MSFYLCTIQSSDFENIFGKFDYTGNREPGKVTSEELGLVMIGQKPDCSEYLALAKANHNLLTKQDSIPSGFDFIFRQEWGLHITTEIIDRVIETLRKEAYPPMTDYLDGLVKGDYGQIQNYFEKCSAVKEKYPKLNKEYKPKLPTPPNMLDQEKLQSMSKILNIDVETLRQLHLSRSKK